MIAKQFNQSDFSCWVNSQNGQLFRLGAGIVFFILGVMYFPTLLGKASVFWSFFPISAGIFDLCYISGVLGGPLQGKKIRVLQAKK